MYSNIARRLRDEAARCDFRVKQTEENTKRIDILRDKMESLQRSINICTIVMCDLDPMLQDVLKFINEKAESGQQKINQALMVAGDIIPDSMKGIQFKTEGDKSWLEVNGMNVDDIEGSGYKGAASMFIQSSILQQNPQYLQTLMFDEPLSKVSVENSAMISTCLPYMCRDMQVILIEQKKEIYANFDHVHYRFFKDENGTRIEREDVTEQGGQVEIVNAEDFAEEDLS